MRQLTVLLVDDDPLMHRLLAPRLARLETSPGVGQVLSATTPEAALDLLEKAQGDPLVVVSDFNLKAPMNGLQLLAEIEKRWPATVRVLISGYNLEQLGDLRRSGAAQGFVEKPLRVDEMLPPLASIIRDNLAGPAAA